MYLHGLEGLPQWQGTDQPRATEWYVFQGAEAPAVGPCLGRCSVCGERSAGRPCPSRKGGGLGCGKDLEVEDSIAEP